jgi:hypothetical protein
MKERHAFATADSMGSNWRSARPRARAWIGLQLRADCRYAAELAPAPSTFKGAIADSFRLLLIEHTTRVAFQQKTRRELGGPFFSDYARSVKIPDTWNDGDSWGVNYIGRFIWLDHEDGAHDPKLGFSREYWASRGRATAWAAVYSLQFEFGPFSEASIGNVGLNPNTTGWVDHVVTPAGALAFMVAEDALDRYLITKIESWTRNGVIRAAARIALNPSRTSPMRPRAAAHGRGQSAHFDRRLTVRSSRPIGFSTRRWVAFH